MEVALNHRIEGEGSPVLFLHPVGLDSTSFDAVATRLASGRRVIKADLRGHGRSPIGAPATSISDHAGDVAALMRKLKLPPCPVVGVSFGGMIATALAIEHPGSASTIVVSACPSSIPDGAREALRARGDAAVTGGMESILAETLERWFSEPFQNSPAVELYRQRLLDDEPTVWRDSWHAIAGLNLTPWLNGIDVPVFCIHAEKDRGTSYEALAATVNSVPNGRLKVILDAPHMAHIEKPEEFSALVDAHLRRLS